MTNTSEDQELREILKVFGLYSLLKDLGPNQDAKQRETSGMVQKEEYPREQGGEENSHGILLLD